MSNLCEVIQIVTPQKFVLDGLWFGSTKAKRAIIFVHGLASNAFSNHKIMVPLASKDTVVTTFSNRGHDKISKLKRLDKRRKKGYKRSKAGEVHEIFTDCVDDIQGTINFAQKRGIREIYLAGHSTGCQKAVYFLSKRGKQKLVKGAILLAPMSDYAAAIKLDDKNYIPKATETARKLVKQGKPHEILPLEIWPYMHDAQRFLSLYSPDSEEEVFSYSQPHKDPKTLKSIRIPTLIIFAEKDEYRDRSIGKIAQWFESNLRSKSKEIIIIPNTPHNFQKHEDKVVSVIKNWLKS